MEVKQHSPLPQQPPFFRPGLGRIPLITPKMEAASSSESHMATSSNTVTGLNLSTSLPGSVLVSTVIKTEPRSRSPCPMVVGSSTSSVPADSPNNNNALMNLSSLALSASGYVVQSQHSVTSPTPAKRPRAALATPEEAWLASPSQMSIDSMSPPPSAPTMQGGPTHAPPSVSSNGYCPSPMSTGSYEPYSPGPKGRDDLSPPGSVNGYGSGGDSMGADLKKKKGPVPRQAEELCLVCGDRASGYHYNALTCEGCKGFFRRSVTKNAIYHCKYGDSCEIDMYMRRKCQECRFKKCLAVGMRSECVVPEQQCVVKREAKKAQKEKEKPNSNPVSSVNSPDSKDLDQHRQQQKGNRSSESQAWGRLQEDKAGRLASPVANVSNPFGIKPLSPEQEELINRLVYFQEEFDQPSEEDLKKVTQISLDGDDSSDRRFKYITEMTILTVQLTVEFSKRLPGFDTLHREDQITLLKACSSEVMMLRCARRYDANSDSIVFANNYPYTKESYKLAGVGDSADAIFHFGRQMANMKVDNAEYALLTAVVIFSERPNLLEARKVEKIQEIYLEALQAYVLNHRPKPMTEFAKLLSVLTELRTLGNLNSEMCFSLKLKNKMLPPFLAELWDVHG